MDESTKLVRINLLRQFIHSYEEVKIKRTSLEIMSS